MRVDISNGIADGGDFLGDFVGDLSAELVLKGHDQLNQVERIGFKVFAETGIRIDLGLIRTE